MRHFLDIADIATDDLKAIISDAMKMKSGALSHDGILGGKSVALIFEKPSTRTRVSFEVGVRQLGGAPVMLRPDECQMGRGESIADTARVLSRYVDCIMIRTGSHDILLELAEHADIPVINGLTDLTHPCQVMADVMTLAEMKAPEQDYTPLKAAWFGDGNNVACSLIDAAAAFGFALDLAVPGGFEPDGGVLARGRKRGGDGRITVTDDAAAAATGADVLFADTWFSMGDEKSDAVMEKLRPYQVNAALMAHAKKDAVFMHCLPAYRDYEVTSDVIDGAQSVVWEEAENRLHVQKAIMAWCVA